MKKFFVYAIMLAVIMGVNTANSKEAEVVSTQGMTFEQGITKTVKTTKAERKEANNERKLKKKYFRSVANLKSLKSKRDAQERELNFIQSRLEIKKHKLEELTSNGSEKGENK